MKLRNKMTGEIVRCGDIYLSTAGDGHYYTSMDELNEEWEDAPEPLIKDEKIREAVRAWAEACRLDYVIYDLPKNSFYDPDTRGRFEIRFTLKPIIVGLEDGGTYAIEELCGEEE